MKKQVIFIGNRVQVLDVCLREPDFEVVDVFAHRGSPLERELAARGAAYVPFGFADKDAVVDRLQAASFDILVSNGCPFILPVARLEREGRLFLNTHPALLPELKGPHPVNALFLEERKAFGATTHFMTDAVDAGNILAQRSAPLTDDMDAGLVYRLSFRMEAQVFEEAVQILKASGYRAGGRPQEGPCSFYKREAEDQTADASREPARAIARKIRAFGVRSLGATVITRHGRYRVFEGAAVDHAAVGEAFGRGAPGEVVLAYDGKLLVETPDGFVKLVVYEELE